MNKESKRMKVYTFDQVKNELIGKSGTPARDRYEFELSVDLLGEMIRTTRLRRNLTQGQLGTLVGVRKAQISKLEKSVNNVTVETILKVFRALKANVIFRVELQNKRVHAA